MKEPWMLEPKELEELKSFDDWRSEGMRPLRGVTARCFIDGVAVFSREQVVKRTGDPYEGIEGDDGYDYYGDPTEMGYDMQDFF